MFFSIICFDKPGVAELREKTHGAHLDYLKQYKVQMHFGGPLENDEGAILGSLFIINVENRSAAGLFRPS